MFFSFSHRQVNVRVNDPDREKIDRQRLGFAGTVQLWPDEILSCAYFTSYIPRCYVKIQKNADTGNKKRETNCLPFLFILVVSMLVNDQHGISIGIEFVFFFNGSVVRLHH